jgi:hypothetical protein
LFVNQSSCVRAARDCFGQSLDRDLGRAIAQQLGMLPNGSQKLIDFLRIQPRRLLIP